MSETSQIAADLNDQPKGNQFDLGAKLSAIFRRGDIMLALGVVAILVVLILPMPKWMLDIR